jgi:undecaprenyl diphosphate synthase
MADTSPAGIARSRRALGIPDERLPRSVAIIIDGNGRWARERGLPRKAGHEEGARTVLEIVSEAAGLGLEAVTVYSFSIENWSRPDEEVADLMELYASSLIRERATVTENNIRLHHLGRRDGLPQAVLAALDEVIEIGSGNTGMHLCLALNYGSRAEIVDAVRRLASRVGAGKLAADDIDEETLSAALDTAGVRDPDLLIRTSGERRLSNFLLWQISYAELYVADVYWPDFHVAEFHKALRDFAGRHRRFGGLDETSG